MFKYYLRGEWEDEFKEVTKEKYRDVLRLIADRVFILDHDLRPFTSPLICGYIEEIPDPEQPKTYVYKVELLIVDHDGMGGDDIKDVLENTRYPNRCINPVVMNIERKEVDWNDDHPLNNHDTMKDEYNRLFNKKSLKKVKCIFDNIEDGAITVNKIYEVLHIYHSGSRLYAIVDDKNEVHGYSADFFEEMGDSNG